MFHRKQMHHSKRIAVCSNPKCKNFQKEVKISNCHCPECKKVIRRNCKKGGSYKGKGRRKIIKKVEKRRK